jgi:hypothetical protein
MMYRDYHISQASDPYYMLAYEFWHDSYDGAPDAYDYRCGEASTIEEAKEMIDDLCEEHEYD